MANVPEIRLEADAPYAVEPPAPGEAALLTPFGRLVGPIRAFQRLERALEGARRAGGAGGTPPSRPLYIPEEILDAARTKAASEFRDLTDVVSDGLRKYMARQLEPHKPARAAARPPGPDGKPPKKKQPNCSVRWHDDEWNPLMARCAADKSRLGWAVTPSKVVTQYLMEDYLPQTPPAAASQ